MIKSKYISEENSKILDSILLERYKSKNYKYKENEYKSILESVKTNLLNDKNNILETDIPIINIDQQELFMKFFEKQQPVIIRGFLKKSILDKYSFDKFIEKYGKHTVRFTKIGIQSKDTFKKLYNIKDNENDEYIHNCDIISCIYPEILEDLQVNNIHKLLKYRENTHCFFSPLFIGNSLKIKFNLFKFLHCAPSDNFFIMINGKKKWTMIDPIWSNLMDIDLNNDNCIRFVVNNNENSLINLLPKKTSILKKGDLLYVPYLYWHAVENITEKSIGMANRCRCNNIKQNTLMDQLKNSNSNYKKIQFKFFKKFFKYSKTNRNDFIWKIKCKNEEEYYKNSNFIEKYSVD